MAVPQQERKTAGSDPVDTRRTTAMEDEKKDRNRENSENDMADSRDRAIGVRFLGLTLLLVFVIECIIMLFMNVYFPLPTVYRSFLDAFLLVVLFFPALYFIVYRPLLRAGSEALYREKKVLLELSESEERFRRISENAPDIILRWNAVTGVEYANPALEKLTGYAPEEVIGNMGFLASKFHPDDIPVFIETMRSMGKKNGGEEAKALEFRMFAKDGSVIWLDARFVPHWNYKGEILSAEIIARTITGRKKAEESLREKERLLGESQKLAHVGSWDVDLKTHAAIWSDELYRIHGYEPGGVSPSYESFLSTVHPDDRDRVFEMTQKAFIQGEPFEDEFRIVRPDGAVRWVHAASALLKDETGMPCRFWGAAQDITDRKAAEDALRLSEEALRRSFEKVTALNEEHKMLLEHSRDFVYRHDKNGIFTYLSPSVERITGYTTGDWFTHYTTYLTDNPMNADVIRFTEETLKTGMENPPYLVEIYHKDGRRVQLEVSECPYFENGEVAGVVGVARDVTERLNMEKTLECERKKFADEMTRLSSAVEQTADMITIANKDGVIEYVNAAFEDLTGYTKAEVIGKTPAILKSGKNDGAFYEHFWNTILSGEVYQGEFINKKKSGEFYTAYKTVTPVCDEDGHITHFVAVDKDVTEKKHEEETREKVVRLESLGVLAGGIAHDFNNLLTAILGNISLSKMSVHPQARMYRLLSEAEKASLRAKDLSKQLLTFSKGGEPVKKATSVEELVRESAEFVLRGSGVRCEHNVAPELWRAYIDAGQIAQVVQNIVLNAAQAMPGGGRVYVTCENVCLDEACAPPLKAGRYVKLLIKDEGGGIPAENLPRIFDPYFTTKEKGSGLGLATAFSIVKKHGGHIDARSETGAGTTFAIFLPTSEEIPCGGAETDGGKVLPVGKGKILVMDDEAPIRMLLNGMLEFLGYEATFACDGAEALELYGTAMKNKEPFHCVLLDLTVPGGMGGKETMMKLLEMDARVNAVVSSGYSDDPVMAQYEKYGFKAVIQKPYDMKKMGEVLNDIIHGNGKHKKIKSK